MSRINAEFVRKKSYSFPKISSPLDTRLAAETRLTGQEILQVEANRKECPKLR